MCAADLFHANMVAREMVLAAGMGRRTGPIDALTLHPSVTADASGAGGGYRGLI
jgi:hypothetical protein